MTRASSVIATEAGQRFETPRPTLAEIHLQARHLQSEAIAGITAAALRGLIRVSGIGTMSHALTARLRRWNSRRRTISVLRNLDDRILQDIGISRGNIEGTVDALLAPSWDQDRAQLGHIIGRIDSRLSGDAQRWALERRARGLLPRQIGDVLPDLAVHRRRAIDPRKPVANNNEQAAKAAAQRA